MHECPAPECDAQVDDEMLACRRDWYRLPRAIRGRVWSGYRRGWHSDAHVAAILEADRWWSENPR